MFGQRTRDLLAYGAMLLDQLRIHIQHIDFGLVRVTNIPGKKNFRGAGNVCDPIGNQSASARFRDGLRSIPLRKQFYDDFLQRFICRRKD